MQEIDTSKITRFEVIDHTSSWPEFNGSRYTRGWPLNDIVIELSIQDDGRTLKVFVKDRLQAKK